MKTTTLFVLFTLTSLSFFSQKDTLVQFKDLSIDSMGDLKWTVIYYEDLRGLSQKIEQFKNDKWTLVTDRSWSTVPTEPWDGKVPFKNIIRDSLRLKFHKGLNKFRIKIKYPAKTISPEIILNSKIANDNGSVWIVSDQIIMDTKEYYEILNSNGLTILKGESNKINISSLSKGSYFLYTKTTTKPFTK